MKRNTFPDKQAAGRAFDGGFAPKQTFDQNSGALKPRTARYRKVTKYCPCDGHSRSRPTTKDGFSATRMHARTHTHTHTQYGDCNA